MKEEIDLPPEVLDQLAADIENEMKPEIDEFLKTCAGKDFSYRENGTLRLRQKFGELLMARAAEVESEKLSKKKMPTVRGGS